MQLAASRAAISNSGNDDARIDTTKTKLNLQDAKLDNEI